MNNNREFYTVRGYQLLGQNQNPLTPALEDYLEMIYRIGLEENFIRMNTLADFLNVKTSSATKMVQKLYSLGFVDYQKYGIISLTLQGKELGKFLFKRHNIIETFLKTLELSNDICMETELIEHNITPHTVENIELLNRYLKQNPSIVNGFKNFRLSIQEQ